MMIIRVKTILNTNKTHDNHVSVVLFLITGSDETISLYPSNNTMGIILNKASANEKNAVVTKKEFIWNDNGNCISIELCAYGLANPPWNNPSSPTISSLTEPKNIKPDSARKKIELFSLAKIASSITIPSI